MKFVVKEKRPLITEGLVERAEALAELYGERIELKKRLSQKAEESDVNENQIRSLDYQLRCFVNDVHRLSELKEQTERAPFDRMLTESVTALEIRLNRILEGLGKLEESELYLIYLHYECGLSFRQMECFTFYSFKALQLKNRTILEKIIRNSPYII